MPTISVKSSVVSELSKLTDSSKADEDEDGSDIKYLPSCGSSVSSNPDIYVDEQMTERQNSRKKKKRKWKEEMDIVQSSSSSSSSQGTNHWM